MKNFVIYNSSAGSGKTYTLVKEYLKLAIKSKNSNLYKHILAITFTNKAAAEMKRRIIEALNDLSSKKELSGTPKFLLEDLLKSEKEDGLGISSEEIGIRSKQVLKSILHNYNDFGVSTIDKFTHKIIRTFAHDLHLPINFDIELDEREVLGAAIDMLISEVGRDKKLTKLLLEYSSKKAEDEESWKIENDLFDFAKNLIKEEGELHLEKLKKLSVKDFESIKNQLYKQTLAFENKVKQLGKEGLDFIKNKEIEFASFSASFFPNYWRDLATFKKFKPTATTCKIINGERNWYASKVEISQKKLIDTFQKELIEQFNNSRTYIDKFSSNYIVNTLIIKNLYGLAVLNEIEKTIKEFKKDNNVLNISDFNKHIAAIVATEPTPFIYERLGEKFNHYLIDEFQDTSIIQWHNLIPLVDNSLASGNFNMVVGDSKQAIYRFRGGEVEQIINLPSIYKHKNNPLLLERERTLARNFREEILNTNFRSKAEIVDFNNQFFQSVSENLSVKFQQLYKNLEQDFNTENKGGGVKIEFLEEENKELYQTTMNIKITAIIAENIKAGYSLKDIAILTRSNKNGSEIANFLLENRINVISSESLLLNNSNEVTFLLNLMQFLSNQNNKVCQVKLLNYLTTYVFDDELFDVFQKHTKNTVVSYLADKNIYFNFKKIANYSLYELVEYLIVTFKFDKKVDVYIQFFLDKIHEYTTRFDNSSINFLEWWEGKSEKFSIVIPEGIDAVRVMSIHKSKGLEFPIVIYPFADSKVRIGENFFWTTDTNIDELDSAIIPMRTALKETRFSAIYNDEIDKSRLDLINLLYVALTRPKERLFIISELNKKPSENGSVADYLYNFCKSKPDSNKTDNTYSFGLFLPKEKQEKPFNNKIFESVSYNNWRDKIQISYQAPKVWDIDTPEKIGEYGTLIHNILSKIRTKDDLNGVLASYLTKGIITEKEQLDIKQELEKLFMVDEIDYLFTGFDELKNERSILLKSGDSFIPDRVVVKDNRVIIIDYKTGKAEKKHFKQLEEYKILLSEMGYQNIETYLLYIKDAKLERVGF